jgi:hypothetical protein
MIQCRLHIKRLVQLLEAVFCLWSTSKLYKQDNFLLSGNGGDAQQGNLIRLLLFF